MRVAGASFQADPGRCQRRSEYQSVDLGVQTLSKQVRLVAPVVRNRQEVEAAHVDRVFRAVRLIDRTVQLAVAATFENHRVGRLELVGKPLGVLSHDLVVENVDNLSAFLGQVDVFRPPS